MRRAAIFAAAALLAGAPAAHGSVQHEGDRAATWLSKTLRAKVPERPVIVTDDLTTTAHIAEAWSDGTIRIRPKGARHWLLRSELLLHEHLHRPELAACWRWRAEEGIVDALVADLMPAFVWQAKGRRYHHERLLYPGEVRDIRAASKLATGAPSWRHRDARIWRRKLWAADCDGRRAMLEDAEAARGEAMPTPAPVPSVPEVIPGPDRPPASPMVPREKLVRAVAWARREQARARRLRATLSRHPDFRVSLQLAGIAYGQDWRALRRCALSEGYGISRRYHRHNYVTNAQGSGATSSFQFMRGTFLSTPFARLDWHRQDVQAHAAAWMWAQGRRGEWAGVGC